jgi:hypothetical protein
MRTLDEAQQVATLRNRKNAKRWPLLAHAGQLDAIVPQVTAGETSQGVANEQRFIEKWAAYKQAALERAEAMQTLACSFLVGQEAEIERLAAERARVYPSAPEYTYGFWWKQLKRLAPETAWQHCRNRPLHAGYLAKWHTACPACGQPLLPKP